MNFWKYFLDRLGYILLYFAGICTAMTVLYLSRVLNPQGWAVDGIFYAFLLYTVFLCIFLAAGYLRKRSFYKNLNRMARGDANLEDAYRTGEAYSCEHRLFRDILIKNYKSYKDSLSALEEAQRQHTYFINQWVHQMKTPVSVINLLLQNDEEDRGALLDSIREENEKLAKGLEMALYTARLSQFHIDFKVERVDLLPLVREEINKNKKSCIKYSIFPKITGEKELWVETDSKWIGFVINQIIANAIKYSRNKESENKSILIEAGREEGKASLRITDEGIGIPRRDLGRVFDAFFTGENGRRYSEATGMGLYLSKRICEELGHEIRIASKEGEWTQVTLTFYEGKSIFAMK